MWFASEALSPRLAFCCAERDRPVNSGGVCGVRQRASVRRALHCATQRAAGGCCCPAEARVDPGFTPQPTSHMSPRVFLFSCVQTQAHQWRSRAVGSQQPPFDKPRSVSCGCTTRNTGPDRSRPVKRSGVGTSTLSMHPLHMISKCPSEKAHPTQQPRCFATVVFGHPVSMTVNQSAQCPAVFFFKATPLAYNILVTLFLSH